MIIQEFINHRIPLSNFAKLLLNTLMHLKTGKVEISVLVNAFKRKIKLNYTPRMENKHKAGD